MDHTKKVIKLNKAVFCISFDFELLYGRNKKQRKSFYKQAQKVNETLPIILNILEKNKIGATWAIVGKLHNHKLTKIIAKSKYQEIGSHSYSHKYFYSIDKSTAYNEINLGINKLAKYQTIKSFVFPKNQIKYTKILKEHDIGIYREKNILNNSLLQLADLYLNFPLTSKLIQKNGLLTTKGTFYFVSARGIRKFISSNTRFKKAQKGIDTAIKRKEIFHLWTHPIDFSCQTPVLIKDFEKIINYAVKLQKEGKIDILTMQELINYK